VREFWKNLKSIRLGIVLIGLIAVGSLVATLIPQGESRDEYMKLYPRLVAEIVIRTGLTRYFSSILFLVPGILFFLNLGACTVDRLYRELKKKARHRHGPDILHVGLLVLILGGLVSFSGRKEGTVMLAQGESVDLPGGEILTLVSFSEARYEDGRPKDWTSVVNLEKSGKQLYSNREIRVNKPLRVGAVTLFQASYASELTLELRDGEGRVYSIPRGHKFDNGKVSVFFMTVEHGTKDESMSLALVRVAEAGKEETLKIGKQGVTYGPYVISANEAFSTGIKAVRDPGYPYVLAALILIGLGTALTFLQKLKDMDKT
jgi:cytochrome c biogenesis protein